MDSLKRMNDAMRYIEAHLTEDIDMHRVAQKAYCSEYHFTRMFSFLAGVTLSEYIRRRRLSLAALDLQTTPLKIIDVALKYGYRSPDAFTRAFQAMHGITPSEAKQFGQSLKIYPPLTFHLTIKGGIAMNYRIEQHEAFTIAGKTKTVPLVFEGVNHDIQAMWQSLTPEDIITLKNLSNREPLGMIQASTNFSEGRMDEQGTVEQYIGVATTQHVPRPYDQLQVAASTWAIFEAIGPFPETLQQTWAKIYRDWLPTSSYEVAPGPEIASIQTKDLSAQDVKCEIWIPLKSATYSNEAL